MDIINKARELLTKQNITSFELDIPAMKFDKTIIFDTFQNYAKITGIPVSCFGSIKDGCTITQAANNVYVILSEVTPTSKGRIKWTLAHEIGHIYLGHVCDGSAEESEANRFAAELLMPELVILELNNRLHSRGGISPSEISRLFGVSLSAAELRLKQVQRKNFFSAYLKREIMEKYDKLIYNYIMAGNTRPQGRICLTITV